MTHDPTQDADITIQSATLAVRIATFGAELQSISSAGNRELLWNGDAAVWKGRAPILFPIVGALAGGRYVLDGISYLMPKHGFARRSRFQVISQSAGEVTMRLAANDQTRAIYPFWFHLEIEYSTVGSSLGIAATIINDDDHAMPASFGFHPAFRWPLPFGLPREAHRILFEHPEPEPVRRIDALGLLMPAPEASPVAGDLLTLQDDLFRDDALIFDQPASRMVRYGGLTGPQLKLRFDDFPVLGIWTKPGADFIAIEPWRGIADPEGFDGDFREKPGVFEIPAGGSRRLTMSISLKDNV